MINVVSKRCQTIGCLKKPTFGHVADGKAVRCVEHKEANMIDVVNKRCKSDGCKKQPWYGVPGYVVSRCAEHKIAGMIAYSKRRCTADQCRDWAHYGWANSAPLFCEKHRSPDHLDLVQRVCSVCQVLDLVDAQNKCSRCSEYLTKRIYLRKQRQVKAWLETEPSLPPCTSYDQRLDGGLCGKERPDWMWDVGTHRVYLEVDEDQHRGKPCECEQTRMVNITQGSGLPGLWVRYNPDAYKGQPAKLKDADRREVLVKTLQWALTSPPQTVMDTLRVVQLFFDGFDRRASLNIHRVPLL